MQATWSEHNWFEDNQSIKRHVIAFVISIVIVILLLAVPLRVQYSFVEDKKVLSLDLIKTKPVLKPVEIEKPINKLVSKPVTEPVSKPKQLNPQSVAIKPIKIDPKVGVPEIIKAKPVNPKAETQKPIPSSAEIFNLTYGKVRLNPIDEDFKARTGHEEDFVFKKMERPEWYKVKKHIDEERDKPSTYMEFYSPGIEGSIERFFDKISYKKRFTTKHGTKIDCGGIGPLVMCSWK
jgi:hypothetical protein